MLSLEESNMRWLISYSYKPITYNTGVAWTSRGEPYDNITITDEHPAVFVIEALNRRRGIEAKAKPDHNDRADEIVRIYSAIQIPDDLEISEEELELLQ